MQICQQKRGKVVCSFNVCVRWTFQVLLVVAIFVYLTDISCATNVSPKEADDINIPQFKGSPEIAAEMAGVYILGFKIAMAAYHHKTSHPSFPREEYFEIAWVVAFKIGVELPPLPSPTGELRKDSENSRFYVNQQVAPLIKEALKTRTYAQEVTAIFDFATYCALAVRFYSPALDLPTNLLVEEIPKLARIAKLPEIIWWAPVKMVEQGKSIPSVQAAFFEIERLILNYYGFMIDDDERKPNPSLEGIDN